MNMSSSCIGSLAGLAIASTLVAAQAEAPKAELIAEWNRLPFHLSDAAAEKAYWDNRLYVKVHRNDVFWILDQGHVAGKPSEPGAEAAVSAINRFQHLLRSAKQRLDHLRQQEKRRAADLRSEPPTNDERGCKFKIHDRSVLEKTPMRTGAETGPT